MKDIIDNLYDFMEDPTSQLKEDVEDVEDVEDEDLYILGIFLSNNLIATRMITTSIQKDEMYDITHLYGKSESIKILSGFLNEDLRNIPNIEQYKIDICNKKLRDLVDLIREEKEIREEKQREEEKIREEKQCEEEKIRKQKQEEKKSGRMGRDDKKRQQKEEEMKKKRQQKEEEMKKKRREKEEEKEKKKKEKEEEKQKKRDGEDDKTRKKREAREAYAKKKKEKKEKNTEEQRGAFDSAWQEDLRRWQEDLRRQQENNDNKHREDLEKNIDLIRGDKYRCVVPFKRSTADTKDRLASCKTTGNFSKGFNRFFEGRQPCIEYCNTE